MPSVKDFKSKIGKKAMLSIPSRSGDYLRIPVEIANIRYAYGRIDFEVKPLSGFGSWWVQLASLDFTDPFLKKVSSNA